MKCRHPFTCQCSSVQRQTNSQRRSVAVPRLGHGCRIHSHHQQEGHARLPAPDLSRGHIWARAKAAGGDASLEGLCEQVQAWNEAGVDEGAKDRAQDLHGYGNRRQRWKGLLLAVTHTR